MKFAKQKTKAAKKALKDKIEKLLPEIDREWRKQVVTVVSKKVKYGVANRTSQKFSLVVPRLSSKNSEGRSQNW